MNKYLQVIESKHKQVEPIVTTLIDEFGLSPESTISYKSIFYEFESISILDNALIKELRRANAKAKDLGYYGIVLYAKIVGKDRLQAIDIYSNSIPECSILRIELTLGQLLVYNANIDTSTTTKYNIDMVTSATTSCKIILLLK